MTRGEAYKEWRLLRARLRIAGGDTPEVVAKHGRRFMVENPDAGFNWGPLEFDGYEAEDTVLKMGSMWGDNAGAFGWHLGLNKSMNAAVHFKRETIDPNPYIIFAQANQRYLVQGKVLCSIIGEITINSWRMSGGDVYPSAEQLWIMPIGFVQDYPELVVPKQIGVWDHGVKVPHTGRDLNRFFSAYEKNFRDDYGKLVQARYWPKEK